MTCPANPPPPAGYGIWRGAVPGPLVQWAVDLRDRINHFPYGQQFFLDYGGQVVIARKDFHQYTYRNGRLVTGICIPGITLYQPVPATAGATALAGDDLTTPDPTAAVYSGEAERPNWGLVALSAAAGGLVVAGFLAVLRRP